MRVYPFLTRGGRLSNLVFTAIFLAGILTMAASAWAEPVNETLAREVAGNFLGYIQSGRSISAVEPTPESGKTVGYVVTLSPRGYILVAGDTVRVPVKAYSLNASFSGLPPAYIKVLLDELEIPEAAVKSGLDESTNASYWDFLSSARKAGFKDYTPDTYLLTTQWNQDCPYNKFNPRVDGQPTLTGCTQTALGQIMRYHAHPDSGSGVFNHTWNSQTLTAVMNRPFNWAAMPNKINGSAPVYQQDEVAALMRDLGILNEANFGIDGTGAAFNRDAFQRAFGYAPIYDKYITDADFFSTLRGEIDNLRPVLLSMPGHMTVADGYASDGAGKRIHVNLGWGGSYDDYYTLDQSNTIGYYIFPPNHTIYYNIQPCQGGECNPYPPLGGGNGPVIDPPPEDMVIDQETVVRLEAYDPDGDAVTLDALSSCQGDLQAQMDANLLTLTPAGTDFFCEVTVNAQDQDGSLEEKFKVLCLDEKIYLGSEFDLCGQFANGAEVDSFTVYMDGTSSLSGYRGYTNQAFFIWVENESGQTVIAADANPITGTLAAGFYTVKASLDHPTSGAYYPYEEDYSSYIITVTCPETTYTVSDLAADLGISLNTDTDEDGLDDIVESGGCTDLNDADSDDDGIPDGTEDANHNGQQDPGETNPCNPDSDDDGILDGTELGYTAGTADTAPGVFVADADPSTATNPLEADSDGDGVSDGDEDANHNGMMEVGETDPNRKAGDITGDGVLSLEDIGLLLRALSGADALPASAILADADGDGVLALNEALLILQQLAK
ncbi:C10 family peptidase [Desulfatibacillum aliphaticivorans]|uniref:C10 family peptidase n=1 Tax=Desulfatibacillum aliphaticivorans TaxID=218208 RepID=UPI0009FC9729|nr:C10 family peptidase [Desulfatibacillum aliphaticivorans]